MSAAGDSAVTPTRECYFVAVLFHRTAPNGHAQEGHFGRPLRAGKMILVVPWLSVVIARLRQGGGAFKSESSNGRRVYRSLR